MCSMWIRLGVQSGRSSNHSDPASTVVASQALVASCRSRTISEPNGRGTKSIDVIDLLQIVPLHAPIRATPIENEADEYATLPVTRGWLG